MLANNLSTLGGDAGQLDGGEFGDSWETTAGLNWWIFRRRELRLSLEYIYDHKSPIGYTAVPQLLHGTGSIFDVNFELSF